MWVGMAFYWLIACLAALVIFILSSCDVPNAAPQMPMSLRDTPDMSAYVGKLTPRTVVLKIDTQANITKTCAGLGGSPRALGCANFRGPVCAVYLPIPRDYADMIWVAEAYHELLHCPFGHWHG